MLWFKRRKIPLRGEEQFLKDRFFSSLHPSEIRELVQCGRILEIDQGESLSPSNLSVIINGQVQFNEQHQFWGQFVGIKAFLSQTTSNHRFNAKTPVVCIEWDCQTLKDWSSVSPERHNLLLSALSRDLLSKIDRAAS